MVFAGLGAVLAGVLLFTRGPAWVAASARLATASPAVQLYQRSDRTHGPTACGRASRARPPRSRGPRRCRGGCARRAGDQRHRAPDQVAHARNSSDASWRRLVLQSSMTQPRRRRPARYRGGTAHSPRGLHQRAASRIFSSSASRCPGCAVSCRHAELCHRDSPPCASCRPCVSRHRRRVPRPHSVPTYIASVRLLCSRRPEGSGGAVQASADARNDTVMAVYDAGERIRENVARVDHWCGRDGSSRARGGARRRHVLLDDVPAPAKTVVARSFAASIGGTFRRIQFTPDLMPTGRPRASTSTRRRAASSSFAPARCSPTWCSPTR